MSYFIFIDNNYVRIFVSLIVLAVIQIPLSLSSKTSNMRDQETISNFISYIGLSIIVYFWCRISKDFYYYKEKSNTQKEFIYNILNNLKNGVILYNVDKQKTKFFSNYLKKYKEFKKDINPIIPQENLVCPHSEVENLVIKEDQYLIEAIDIFKHNTIQNPELPQEFKDEQKVLLKL